MSNKIINGKEVILVSEAVMYVKKMGYRVIPPISKTMLKSFGLAFLLIFSTSMVSAVSSNPLWTLDLSNTGHQVIFYVYFAIALVLLVMKRNVYSGFMLTIGGILLALNQIGSIIIWLLLIGLGIIIVSRGDDR